MIVARRWRPTRRLAENEAYRMGLVAAHHCTAWRCVPRRARVGYWIELDVLA